VSDWLHNLPVAWMALVVFGFTYLVAATIYGAVMALAIGERARSFKAVSPGMLPPLGIIFGLFVAFTAAQVWSDIERANAAVDREASALRAIVVMAANFPEETAAKLRALMRSYIEEAANLEWPRMAEGNATLTTAPEHLVQALQLTIALTPSSQGQQIAQRELITAIESVFDARRQRIITSRSQVNPVKWLCLFLQAACALLAIAMVHSDNRFASAVTMSLFATGVAASVLLIAAHDRPFTGEISVRPDPLLQVMPQIEAPPPKSAG
jgi:hypothetical protein